MKKLLSILLVLTFSLSANTKAQNPVNWTSKQLMEPATLASMLHTQHGVPVIICVGPDAIIPNSIDAGMASKSENMTRFKGILSKMPKNKSIVIYCGCCPFEHCPNVRPAIETLKQMGFTNYYLLNLPHNIRQDWIDKGYPVTKS